MLVGFCFTVIVVFKDKFYNYPHLDEKTKTHRNEETCSVDQILEFWLSSFEAICTKRTEEK